MKKDKAFIDFLSELRKRERGGETEYFYYGWTKEAELQKRFPEIQKNEKEINEYNAFFSNEDNEFNCDDCPENRNMKNCNFPCGQQLCWVTCHLREIKW